MIHINRTNNISAEIPDNSRRGHVDAIEIFQHGKIDEIKVQLNVKHTFIGDLKIKLTSPAGRSVILHDHAGGSDNHINKLYTGEILKPFLGDSAAGKWKLQLTDISARDTGSLESWQLIMACQTLETTHAEVHIPDNSATGLMSEQEVRMSGRVTDISAKVNIEHAYVGDLEVALISPAGKTVNLHQREDGALKVIDKTYGKDILKDFIGDEIQGKWVLRIKDFAKRDAGVLKHWKLNLKYQQIDDLKVVEGIGPKIEGLFNDAGIYSWSKLSVTSASVLKDILERAGDRYKMHNPKTWPDQAALAAAGRMEDLKAWQDELDGGK
ncbi:MAG: proprotein convertase P-domain-containing protein [Saprospiraceae bacterium]